MGKPMNTLALLLLLFPSLAPAAEKFRAAPALLLPAVTKNSGARQPATIPPKASESNEDVYEQLPVGATAMIQNSFGKWNNQVVRVIAIYEDKSIRIKLPDGSSPIVRFDNLKKNLSPVADCGVSLGTTICRGDKVLYGLASASVMIPEAEVMKVFKNNHAIVRDGTDFELELNTVGKETNCSPQKPSICVDSDVLAEGYNDGSRYVLEGKIQKAYSHGVVLVRVSPTMLIPIDAMAVKKRIAAEAVIDDPAVLSNHDMHNKPSYTVLPELEPLNPNLADHMKEAR
jgi:hypothetical protein